MADDDVSGVLLEAAAANYVRACEAWTQCHQMRTSVQREELARAVSEARSQLYDAARRFKSRHGGVDWEVAFERAAQRIVELEFEVEGLRALKRGVDDPLN